MYYVDREGYVCRLRLHSSPEQKAERMNFPRVERQEGLLYLVRMDGTVVETFEGDPDLEPKGIRGAIVRLFRK
jgi:hypothetical protein